MQHFELARWRCKIWKWCNIHSGLFVCALALQEPYADISVVYLREDIYDCLAQPPLLHRAQEVEIVWFHLYPNEAFSFILHALLESSGGRLTSRKPLTFM